MNRKLLLLPLVLVAIVSLACSVTFNLPQPQVKTIPTVTDTINVPLPADKLATQNLELRFGAGNLNLQPGATDTLVSGTATYNVIDFKPNISINGNNVTIEQGNVKINGIPELTSRYTNDWNLSLGNLPTALVVKAGAYSGKFELGGLSLVSLDVTDGASQVYLGFSKPNMVEMSTLKYSTGASQVSIVGLANANVDTVSFNSGAGSYTLDFSGQLQRDMTVSVESGVSSVTLIVPQGVHTLVTSESTLISVSAPNDWTQKGNNYEQAGTGHTITILAKMGAGSLQIQTSR